MESAHTRRAGRPKKIARPATAPRFDSQSILKSSNVGIHRVNYRSGRSIFRQGDPAGAVFYIEKGGVRITVVSEYGRKGNIAQLQVGEFFGEGCLAGQDLCRASAAAIGLTTVVHIDKATMVRVLHDEPEMAEMFMSFLLTRNSQIEADLVDQLFNSSERRLARVLLLLANFGKEGKHEKVIPPVNRKELAAEVGTTRARIDFFMNKFRNLGFIEYIDGSKKKGEEMLKVCPSLLNIIIRD